MFQNETASEIRLNKRTKGEERTDKLLTVIMNRTGQKWNKSKSHSPDNGPKDKVVIVWERPGLHKQQLLPVLLFHLSARA